MISTARVVGYISKLDQYQAAITNFKTVYKFYPGDSPNFIPAGNGDYNNYANAPTCQGIYQNQEDFLAWAQLYQGQMVKEPYYAWQPASCGGSHSNSTTNFLQDRVTATLDGIGKLYFSDCPNCLEPANFYTTLLAIDAIAIDAKTDDGKSNSGRVFNVDLDYPWSCSESYKYHNDKNLRCSMSKYFEHIRAPEPDLDALPCAYGGYCAEA